MKRNLGGNAKNEMETKFKCLVWIHKIEFALFFGSNDDGEQRQQQQQRRR